MSLEQEDHARDAAFNKILHGNSATTSTGLSAIFRRDPSANKEAVTEYFKHWDKAAKDESDADRANRTAGYATLTKHYYNLTTDFYEYGWGQSFHFCRFAHGEPFYQAIARHEHYLAHSIGIKDGMRVLDVGCGVGGPAREIAKFTNCHITGLNNNDYQIQRAIHYAKKDGLSDQLDFVKGDFMQMSFADNSFDAIYAIEATVHAPTLEGVYSEIFRVLKPGGVFGVYEWLMTEKYDHNDLQHRAIRLGIEQGDGISNMCKIDVALQAIKAVGFELVLNEDLADRPDPYPWYWPLSGDIRHLQSFFDLFTVLRMTKVGRFVLHNVVGALETCRIAPAGTRRTSESLAVAADCLVAGGQQKLFTPMYLMVARKPADQEAR